MLIYLAKKYHKMKNSQTLLVANKDTGLEVNADKAKYTFMSRHQSAGQTYNFTIANKSCPCDQLSTTP
jgi:hypothetical protein